MRKTNILIALLLCAFMPTWAKGAKQDKKTFIDQLMAKMTIDEKIGQLNLQVAGDITTGSAQNTQVGGLIAQGNMGGIFNLKGFDKIKALQDIAVKKSRLGIPLIVGMDVIHGYETIFPIPIAQSMSWDTTAIERAAAISAKEATADGVNWFYSPMVDICIDPRWGRVAEGNGEDPYLSSVIAGAYVRGYQGNTVNGYEVNHGMACVKHYALYGASEAGRDYNTVDMSRLRMYNQYLPPYRGAVKAGVGSVMSSFNLVDYVPATQNHWLMTDVLRNQWGFKGFTVTDYGSLGETFFHGTSRDMEEAAVRGLKAGTDMDMCTQSFLKNLHKALDEGKVTEENINRACRRILEAKWDLGLFDDPYRYLDKKRRAKDIYTEENRKTSRDFAAETFVLLKNQDNLLPLKKQGKIALIGPLANDRMNIAGTWCVAYTPERYSTLKEAMERAVAGKAEVLYAQGCNLMSDSATQVAAEFGKTIKRGNTEQMNREALDIARQADVIVCAMGECADMCGESSSMANISMPDEQHDLLVKLTQLGKPIVLLNFSGRPTILKWENDHLPAIMNVWFGGSEAGDAICDVLFGDKSPSGKLTLTFPQAQGQIPIYYNHLNTGRPVPEHADHYFKYASNYLDVRNDPLFPFGYGLSYTHFSYSDLTLSADKMTQDGKVTASITVTNDGQRDGDEIVQLYMRDLFGTIAHPVKELKGFKRIHLAKGESKTVTFEVGREQLQYYDAEGNAVLEPGDFLIMAGPNSQDVKMAKLTVE